MQPAGVVKPSGGLKLGGSVAARPLPARAAQRPQATPRDGPSTSDRMVAGLLGVATAVSLALAPPSFAASSPFLKSTGGRGPLEEVEAELFELRELEEAKAREELVAAYNSFEEEAKRSQGDKFCATPYGIDVVGITEFVALTGALVGGVSARRRKEELERLNEQLRTINTQLRQQARAGTLFAPGLTYVPPGGGAAAPAANGAAPPAPAAATKLSLPSVTVRPAPSSKLPASAPKPAAPAAEAAAAAAVPAVGLVSIDDEDLRPEVKQCQAALREGKKLLKDSASGPAMVRFEKALMLAKSMGDRVRERRAVRGLAAASRLSGQSRAAIKYLERVLEISEETGDHVGDADAYGVIADIYTDIGEFEKAAEFYDKYIGRMNTDGPV